MSKEYWIQCEERAIVDISEELDIEMDKAEEILKERLDKNTHYLDGYLAY